MGLVVDAITRAHPDACVDAARLATALCRGQYDLLGYKGLAVGPVPRWHYDPVHDRESPLAFWTSVPYLDPAVGDHKVIWELNRHHHWLTLGRAYALSHDRRFYDEFASQFENWLAANPPLMGTNWASMLELGLRVITWLWALELFVSAASGDDREPWLVDMLLALDRQLTHIEHNLSHYFSPNTHLLGEALALYVASLALPELTASTRRAAVGRELLVQEAARQLRADGGHVELSLHYHRYSTDFYLLAAIVARNARDPAGAAFEEAARRQAHYLRVMTDDTGVRPQIGDDDGGQLFPMCGRDPADCRDTFAVAALLLNEPALAIGPPPEEAYWLHGAPPALSRYAADYESSVRVPPNGGAHSAPASRGPRRAFCARWGGKERRGALGPRKRPSRGAGRSSGLVRNPTRWTSAALPASGYFVSRTPRGDHLIFDAGPHGFLNGGHAHADALACVLSIAGRPVLIDAGTATYTMDAKVRDQFRSTKMHNTVVLNGREPSIPSGAFHWDTAVNAHAPIWHSTGDCDYVEGTHDGYAPWRHVRAILAMHRFGWCIVDHVLGSGPCAVECYWHLHPMWRSTIEHERRARLETIGATVAMASSVPLILLSPGTHALAVRSPAYGVIEAAPVLVGTLNASRPTTIATFISATDEVRQRLIVEPLEVQTPPGPGWHGAAFRVRWDRGGMVLLAAVEALGVATTKTAAPDNTWGCVDLLTDARVAAVIDDAAGTSEAIVVNGAVVSADPTHRLISLPRRVPLMRRMLSVLTPSVQ